MERQYVRFVKDSLYGYNKANGQMESGAGQISNILIDGYYGFENLGDEAILRAILSDVREILPDAHISVLSNNPEITAKLHGVRAVNRLNFNRLNFLDVMGAVSASDVVVIGGGGLFHENYRLKLQGLLDSTFFSTTAILAKAYGKPLYYYAVGLGPFYTPEGFSFATFVLFLSDFVSVRDDYSMQLATALGKKEVVVTADPAFLLEPVKMGNDGRENIIFLSLREWIDQKLEQRLLRETASALETILLSNDAFRVVYLPFQTWNPAEHNDTRLFDSLLEYLPESVRARIKLSIIPDPQDMVNFLSKGLFMIGERLHSVILSVVAGIPFIALKYDRKVGTLCRDLGMENFCLNIDQDFAEELVQRAGFIEKNQEEMRERIKVGRSILKERAMLNKKHFSQFLNATSPLKHGGVESDFEAELVKDLSKKIERQWDQVDGLNAELRERDRRIAQMQEELAQKDIRLQEELAQKDIRLQEELAQKDIRLQEELAQKDIRLSALEEELRNLQAAVTDKEMALNKIYNSDGWRLLTAYYRIRDKLFVPNSRLRLLARLFLSIVRRRKFIREEASGAHDNGFSGTAGAGETDNRPDGFPSFIPLRDENRILVVDWRIPTYDQDSGSLRMYSILKILMGLRYRVTFLGDDLVGREPYLSELKAMGIEVLYGNINVETYLRKTGSAFSYVILSRPDQAFKYIPLIRAYAVNATVIYDTVDLQWLRFERGATVTHDTELLEQARYYRKIESVSAACSDVVLTVTEDEKRAILDEDPKAVVKVLPNIHEVIQDVKPFHRRKDLMFIGGFWHKPNEDAVLFFVAEIFPLIKKRLPQAKFMCVGSNPSDSVLALASEDISVAGYVKDVSPFLRTAGSLCPL